jgi:hypothetical protein
MHGKLNADTGESICKLSLAYPPHSDSHYYIWCMVQLEVATLRLGEQ